MVLVGGSHQGKLDNNKHNLWISDGAEADTNGVLFYPCAKYMRTFVLVTLILCSTCIPRLAFLVIVCACIRMGCQMCQYDRKLPYFYYYNTMCWIIIYTATIFR